MLGIQRNFMWCSTGFNTWTKIIYIDDICNISSSFKFRLFVDDANICSSGYDINDICVKVNSELCSQCMVLCK